MKKIKTFTFEVETDKLEVGPALKISEKDSKKLWERAMKAVKGAETTGELIAALFEEFDGNEFLYVYGFMWYSYGKESGIKETLNSMVEQMTGRWEQ